MTVWDLVLRIVVVVEMNGEDGHGEK